MTALTSLTLTAACTQTHPQAQEEPKRALRVFAATSLIPLFEALERSLEEREPSLDVQMNFAGSQTLRRQIEAGAPADLFASADEHHMNALAALGFVEAPVVFARNTLTLITPLDNPAQIKALSDLPRAQRLVLGGEEVPVGRYARQLLRSAAHLLGEGEPERLLARLASEEPNAGLVRSKVALGEADAAFVYATDALNNDRVQVIPLPQALNVSARYPIAVVKGASAPAEARRLIEYVRSAQGLSLLKRLGYLPP